VLEALIYQYSSTVELEVEISVINSHHVVDKTELRNIANRMLSKPGYCRFDTSSSMTFISECDQEYGGKFIEIIQ